MTCLNAPEMSVLALDNPIWAALCGAQWNVAQTPLGLSHHEDSQPVEVQARRFNPDIGPLSGLACQSPEAYGQLAKLAGPNEQLVLFLDAPPALTPSWHLDVGGFLTQMMLEKPLEPVAGIRIEPLNTSDVPDMLALTRLTKPGPFREKTIQLGGYVGIRESGRLVAMAGERLQLPGYTEISAVCTHPDFQGKHYARALIAHVAEQVLARGQQPFLHTGVVNSHAIALYEKLGFKERRRFHLAVIRLTEGVGQE